MKTSSLEILEKTQLPTAQARAILEIMDREFAEHGRSLATGPDLLTAKNEILNKLVEFGHRFELESKAIRTDLATSAASLEVKLAGVDARLTRWVFTCILGQSAIFASALYFAFTHVH